MFTSAILYKILLLAVIISAYLALRQNPKKEFKFLLVWLAIFSGAMLFYTLFH